MIILSIYYLFDNLGPFATCFVHLLMCILVNLLSIYQFNIFGCTKVFPLPNDNLVNLLFVWQFRMSLYNIFCTAINWLVNLISIYWPVPYVHLQSFNKLRISIYNIFLAAIHVVMNLVFIDHMSIDQFLYHMSIHQFSMSIYTFYLFANPVFSCTLSIYRPIQYNIFLAAFHVVISTRKAARKMLYWITRREESINILACGVCARYSVHHFSCIFPCSYESSIYWPLEYWPLQCVHLHFLYIDQFSTSIYNMTNSVCPCELSIYSLLQYVRLQYYKLIMSTYTFYLFANSVWPSAILPIQYVLLHLFFLAINAPVNLLSICQFRISLFQFLTNSVWPFGIYLPIQCVLLQFSPPAICVNLLCICQFRIFLYKIFADSIYLSTMY